LFSASDLVLRPLAEAKTLWRKGNGRPQTSVLHVESPERRAMTLTLKERYELAKQRHREADRALSEGDGRQACPAEMAKLRHDLERATEERRRAFERYMNSDET
jgi:hypothetical protein